MSSGMNLEQAKEYAKTMTYSEAVSNVKYSKGIKYRKATMIKLRELAEIAGRLDRKTEPNVVMPKKCKGCDSASKIIEAYSRGFEDGAEAAKTVNIKALHKDYQEPYVSIEQTEPQTETEAD